MYHQHLLQSSTAIILCFVILLLVLLALIEVRNNRRNKALHALSSADKNIGDALQDPPSPRKLPLIGHLHLLSGYEVPYQAFTQLGKRFGNVVMLRLGNVDCVVVNGHKNIREALVTKGHHFDARPSFERYQRLFSGDKENSLAFCNWSDSHKNKRDMLRAFTFPRAFTHKFNSLDQLITDANQRIVTLVDTKEAVELKPIILQQVANIFTNHFCTKDFDTSDASFIQMTRDFDEIFYEVNQGYAADFLPFLLHFHQKNLDHIQGLTHRIRHFILDQIICERYNDFSIDEEPVDYVDSLIKYVKGEESPKLDWETALFALEDIIGGHSAVGNFLMKLFSFLVKEEQVQRRIQQEIDQVTGVKSRQVSICDRSTMPYTEAAIFEAIRLISSPIVPRVANQDSSVNGYRIRKDTVLFLNNHELSMSDELWDEPDKFKPERFIREGRVFKPDFFLPFGGGRRSCMGYKMVQLISFGILAGLLQHHSIRPVPGEQYKVPVGSLALPKDTFKFNFIRR